MIKAPYGLSDKYTVASTSKPASALKPRATMQQKPRTPTDADRVTLRVPCMWREESDLASNSTACVPNKALGL